MDTLVITHETRGAWSPLRRVFGLYRAYVCDSGLKGWFPVAQNAALGSVRPVHNLAYAHSYRSLGQRPRKNPAENH